MWPSQLNRNLRNCEVSRKNVFWGFIESVASAFALQCSTSWAMKTHTMEAGQFIEFINPWKEWNREWNDVNCGNTNEISEYVTIAVESQFKQYCEVARKKINKNDKDLGHHVLERALVWTGFRQCPLFLLFHYPASRGFYLVASISYSFHICLSRYCFLSRWVTVAVKTAMKTLANTSDKIKKEINMWPSQWIAI